MPQPRKHPDPAARQRAYRLRQAEAVKGLVAAAALPPAPAISTMPPNKRWTALQDRARAALETVQTEMEDYQGQRTDEWQETDRGTEFQDRLDAVAAALDAIDGIEFG